MSKGYNNLGEKIKRLRTLSGHTQTELGSAIGLPKQSISMIEKGGRSVSSEELEKIGHLLNVPLFVLLEEGWIENYEKDHKYKPENKWKIEVPPPIDEIIVNLEDYFDNLIDEGYGNTRMYIKSIEDTIKVFKLWLKEYKEKNKWTQ